MAEYWYIGQGGTVVGYDPILRDSNGDPILDSNGQYIETDISTHLRAVIFSASSGAVAGGTATVSSTTETLTYQYSSVGGAVVGYDPILRDSSGDPILDSNGQYIETDVSTHLRAVVLTPTGGAIVGGTIGDVQKSSSFVASAGAVVGGSSTVAQVNLVVDSIVPIGGAIVGGFAPVATGSINPEGYQYIAVGGSVAGGTATVRKEATFSASSGAVAGGEALVDSLLNTSYVSVGGAASGGASTVKVARVVTASSGAVTGGTVRTKVVATILPSAGAVVGGSADASSSELQYSDVFPVGGAVCSGQATVRRSRSETSPGVVFFKYYKNTEFYRYGTNTIFYRDETITEIAA